jgi:hypothetical protein
MRKRFAVVSTILSLFGALGGAPALATINCNRTSVGFVPFIDSGQATHQGFQEGLYPGGSNVRPSSHDADADLYARIELLDPNGRVSLSGRIVFLAIGMSIARTEFLTFTNDVMADPARNQAVTLVNGAQNGWSAQFVADPNQNSVFWYNVDAELLSSSVTPLQVEVVWLKEAVADPWQIFPLSAQTLQGYLQTIVQMIKSRYPNTRQIYLSSRSYAGYATTNLDPEPYAFESAFGVKWLIEAQLNGSAALNFNPKKGAVNAPWLAWGPYLWADYDPEDGTHLFPTGWEKSSQMLRNSLEADPVAQRWYSDCAPSDPGAFSVPADALNVRWSGPTSPRSLLWDDLAPSSGTATTSDVVTGRLTTLRSTQSFSGSTCAASSVAGGSWIDSTAVPLVGQPVYYLIRGHNSCGPGTYGDPKALPAPRAALDASSPCP